MGKEVKTNAMRILDRHKVAYEILNYECDEFIDGLHTAELTGAPVEQTYKTLVMQGKSKAYYVFVVQIAEEVDLKAAARAAGEKSVEMIHVKDITKIMLKQFAKRVKNQMDMELCIADDVVDFISDKGFDKDYGARPIRRALQTELEDVLAEAVLMGDISIGDTVDVSLSCEGTKKKIVVKKKTFADEKK